MSIGVVLISGVVSRPRKVASAHMASSPLVRPPSSATPAGSATPGSTTDRPRYRGRQRQRRPTVPVRAHRRGSIKDGAVRSTAYNWTGPYIGAFVGSTVGTESWRFVDPPQRAVPGLISPDTWRVAKSATIFSRKWWSALRPTTACRTPTVARPCLSERFLVHLRGVELTQPWFSGGEARLLLGDARCSMRKAVGRWRGYLQEGMRFNNVIRLYRLLIFLADDISKWRNGWTLGGGMEFALTDRWSAKAEYMHYDLGSEVFAIQRITPGGAPAGVFGQADVDTRGDIVRIGVNYHFAPRCCDAPLK